MQESIQREMEEERVERRRQRGTYSLSLVRVKKKSLANEAMMDRKM